MSEGRSSFKEDLEKYLMEDLRTAQIIEDQALKGTLDKLVTDVGSKNDE